MRLNLTLISFAAATLMLAACNGKQANKPAPAATAEGKVEGVKIAYVDVDSLMKKYQYCLDYAEVLKKKTETIQNTLQSRGLALQKEAADFQSKVQQGGYTREQAEAAQTSLQKKQMQLQNLQQSLANEFDALQTKYNNALRDSVQNFLKGYNKTYGYTFILSKAGDNILLADDRYDITDDVIKALNKRYKPGKDVQKVLKKKK
jgi:outer membrane protein